MDILHENVCPSVTLHRSRQVKMALRKLTLLRHLISTTLGSVAIIAAGIAQAAVTEPDGLAVPNLAANTGPNGNNETDLRNYFAGLGETFDVMADASADPGVFSPLCDFSAEMILSQSQGKAGVAWYNVPSDPTSIPDKIYQLLPPSNQVPVGGGVATSADIRSNSNYAGGLIGFVLTDNGGPTGPDGTSRIYYSEPKRNINCSGCTTPGYWVMTLAYKSTLPQYPNTYYLAFEDWYTTSSTSRGQTDCDFNDKVFRISGIQCQGGGAPCDTGLLGVCKPGLTECTIGTTLVCRPQVPKSDERCDNVDNNCDGIVDNGDNLCPNAGDVCVNGNCVGSCSQTEFPCPSNLACNGKYCVEPACVSVTCNPGLVCRAGQCIDACSGVVCPLGQLCETGICVDPCKNVTCDAGTVCANGACIATCGCAGCPAGKVCKTDGSCVDSGCESQACAAGQVCIAGACVDACKNAVCPGSAGCTQGQCGTPIPGAGGAGGASSSTPVLGGGIGNNSTNGTGPNSATGTNNTGASGPGVNSTNSLGCGCRVLKSRTPALPAIALVLISLSVLRRRRPAAD
jgi:hypothetical protein